LSYPEILPAAAHSAHLYRSDAEFRKKLRWAIENVHAIRREDASPLVARFGWDRLVAEYDSVFEAAADARK
jgi:hypothetical protein